MRIDEEPILGEPVTIDMPNACINPVDFSKTWIDKYGTKHHMFSNDPILDDEGEVDYKRATEIWRENEEKCYEWIIENKIDLLIKQDNSC